MRFPFPKFRFVLLACALVGAAAHGAWQPGLKCGFHLDGVQFDRPLLWTGSSLDTVAATNWNTGPIKSTAPVITNGNGQTTVWSTGRCWDYRGEIYLQAGKVFFGTSIDDAARLEIDGAVVCENTGNGLSKGELVFEAPGWHPFRLQVADAAGAAGPSFGKGVEETRLGFAIKEGGATQWSYPADDGKMTRYRYDDGLGFDDSLLVSASPAEVGEVSPAYGESRGYAKGDTIACSAPATVTPKGSEYTLQGYVIYTNRDAWVEAARGTAADVPFDYVHPGHTAVLRWLYACRHKLEVLATPGGTVSTFGGWYDLGSEVTLTASPEDGGKFISWLGDLPEGCDPSQPVLALTIDKPRSVTAMFQAASLVSKVFTGPAGGEWDEASNWTPSGIPGVSDRVYLPENARVAARGTLYGVSLTISNNAVLSVFGSSLNRNEKTIYAYWGDGKTSSDCGRPAFDHVSTAPLKMAITEDVTLLGSAQLLFGGQFQRCLSTIEIGGDLTLSGTSCLDVYPGPAEDYAKKGIFGATVSVAGKTVLSDEASIALYNQLDFSSPSAPRRGTAAPVFLDLHETTIGEGASIKSWAGLSQSCDPRGPWAAGIVGTAAYPGGGHGGRGGKGAGSNSVNLSGGGRPYDHALAPLLPGGNGRDFCTMGGGVVRLSATSLTVDGTIDVTPFGVICPWEFGGSAGGSIWLTCDTFVLGPKGRLRADGQPAAKFGGHNCGGGGGGRIAVGVGLDETQLTSLRMTGKAENLTPAADLAAIYPGRVTAEGGAPAYLGEKGENGTAVLYCAAEEGSHILSVTIDPVLPVRMTPGPGLNPIPDGTKVEASVEPFFYPDGATDRRRVCTGYELKDASGTVVASGTTSSCTIDSVSADLTLTWLFEREEFLVSTASLGDGEVKGAGWYEAGNEALLTAVPAPGASFEFWFADRIFSRKALASPTISIVLNEPLTVSAVFSGRPAPSAKRFIGATKGSWDDGANWEPAGVPDLSSDVIIPADVVVDLPAFGVAASLSLEPGAVLSVCGKTTDELDWANLTLSSRVRIGRLSAPHEPGSQTIGLCVADDVTVGDKARLTIGGFSLLRPSILAVGGSFRVGKEARFQMYGGPTNSVSVTLRTGGGRVAVRGAMTLAPGSVTTLYPQLVDEPFHSFGRLGPVVLDAAFFELAEGASLLSQAGSSARTIDFTHMNPGADPGGAGHGGIGGGKEPGEQGGPAYDSPYAPVLPGFPGRGVCNLGGGVVRIESEGVRLAGTIDVSPVYYSERYEQAGGSGGSIWITANQWSVAPSAVLAARGQQAEKLNGTGTHDRGGGAGGRVALGRCLTDADLDVLYRTGDVDRMLRRKDLRTTASFFRGTIDVSGGEGVNKGLAGSDGTAWLLDAAPLSTMLLLR